VNTTGAINSTAPEPFVKFKLLESPPQELQTSLPSIEQIERELAGTDGPDEEQAV
jgi:hypothetical protein